MTSSARGSWSRSRWRAWPLRSPRRSSPAGGRRAPTSSRSCTRNNRGSLAMAKLTYSSLASLDGYIADENGNFDWAAPDDELHAFVNDLERPVGTYLYGRRMYETMVYWETALTGAEESAVGRDFARIWQAAD